MIEAVELTKHYGSVFALQGVSFSVSQGQVVGFLGPNGAGKTTTMKILTGFLAPTGGRAIVGGHDVTGDPLPGQKLIGYLAEGNPLYPELRVEEVLLFAGRMRGLRGNDLHDAVDASIDAVNLTDKRRRICGTMSRGERQRVGVAQALLHKPPVLILDEPTSGLDPNQQAEMRSLIRTLGRERTILFSTHILTEVDAVCDRAVIISGGLVVADGTIAEIHAMGPSTVDVVVRAQPEAAKAAFEGLPGFQGIEAFAVPGDPDRSRVRLYETRDAWGARDAAACERVIARAAERRLGVTSVVGEAANLDLVFRTLTAAVDDPGDAGDAGAGGAPVAEEPAHA